MDCIYVCMFLNTLPTGLRGVSVRAEVSVAVHFPEEEHGQEGDGLPILLQLGEVSCGTSQLHRHSSHGYIRKLEREG